MKKIMHIKMLMVVLLVFGSTEIHAARQTICHFPPGNPDNWHTITVSDNAVASHVENHGDLFGSCSENCDAICDDGDFCTQDVLSTTGGACYCISGERPTVDCDDSNECTEDSCNQSTGCVNDTYALDGMVCDDKDPNTTNDICYNGICLGDPPVTNPCPCYGLTAGNWTWDSSFETDLCFIDWAGNVGIYLNPPNYLTGEYLLAGETESGAYVCIVSPPTDPNHMWDGVNIFLTFEEYKACYAQLQEIALEDGVICGTY